MRGIFDNGDWVIVIKTGKRYQVEIDYEDYTTRNKSSMKKYIVLSVNDNPDYLFHVPLTVWAWKYFGWEPIIFYNSETWNNPSDFEILVLGGMNVLPLSIQGYQSDTITQVSRLYGSCIVDGYVMTGDIDMLPISDYWKPEMDKLTVYGRDLTDYHYPICYIGAPSVVWSEIMHLSHDDYNGYIKYDLDRLPQAKSNDKTNRWVTDQDLITKRINDSKHVPTRIDRGTDNRTGYPIGRVDRSNWTLDHKEFVDCHMFHSIQNDDAKFKKTIEMLHTVFPNEDFKWWINYVKEFRKLCNGNLKLAK